MTRWRILQSAFRELWRNPLRSFIMMIGIIVGITALTLIVAVGSGARQQILDLVKSHGLDTIMIRPGGGRITGPGGDRSKVSLTFEDAEAIVQEISGVVQVSPVQNKGGMEVKFGAGNTSTMVFGVMPNWADVRGWTIERGAFVHQEDIDTMARVCVIGQTVLKDLFAGIDPLDKRLRIGNTTFTVQGVFAVKGASVGGSNRDNRIVIPITTAARRLFNQTHLNQIMVQLAAVEQMEQVAQSTTELLRRRHRIRPGMPDDFNLRLPKELIERAKETSVTLNWLLVFTAAVALVVGGIVIMNIMLVSVSERQDEIGLRKAVGARSRDIVWQFLVETVAVAVGGGVIGLVGGLVGANLFTVLSDIPTAVSWEVFAWAFGFSLVVGLLSGILPARRAAALNPVDALT